MPTTKSKKHSSNPTQARPRFGKPKTIAGWLWSALLGAITLVGGWTIVRPVVRVDPYIQLDPSFPFSERFKVSNDGYFALHDVEISCLISNAAAGGFTFHNNLLSGFNYRKVIEAGFSTTIDCPFDRVFSFESAPQFTSAELAFDISFRPFGYMWDKHKTVKFSGQLDSQGNVHWVY